MRHHYVPEFLQKPWTENSVDGKLEVFRLDLPNIPSKRHTPKYTGFDNDLYALTMDTVAGMEKQAVEKLFLKIIDNNAARVRDKMGKNGLKSLTIEDGMDWARFLMSLRLRQPNIMEILKQDSAEHLRITLNEQHKEYEELATFDDAPTLEEWTEKKFPGLIENFGLSFFHELVDNPEIGEKILKMKWWLWDFSEAPYDLLLSDHPCIFTLSIDDPNCVVALPIDPKKAFMATQSDKVAAIVRRQRPKDLAMRLNESSVNQAQARIYAPNELSTRNRLCSPAYYPARFPRRQIHLVGWREGRSLSATGQAWPTHHRMARGRYPRTHRGEKPWVKFRCSNGIPTRILLTPAR